MKTILLGTEFGSERQTLGLIKKIPTTSDDEMEGALKILHELDLFNDLQNGEHDLTRLGHTAGKMRAGMKTYSKLEDFPNVLCSSS